MCVSCLHGGCAHFWCLAGLSATQCRLLRQTMICACAGHVAVYWGGACKRHSELMCACAVTSVQLLPSSCRHVRPSCAVREVHFVAGKLFATGMVLVLHCVSCCAWVIYYLYNCFHYYAGWGSCLIALLCWSSLTPCAAFACRHALHQRALRWWGLALYTYDAIALQA